MTEFYNINYYPDHYEELQKHNSELQNIESRKIGLFQIVHQKLNKNYSSLESLAEFINKTREHLQSKNLRIEDHIIANVSNTYDELLSNKARLSEGRKELDDMAVKVNNFGDLLWTLTTAIFVIGTLKFL